MDAKLLTTGINFEIIIKGNFPDLETIHTVCNTEAICKLYMQYAYNYEHPII